MHQPVVIGPTANPIEPGLEQFEFAVAEVSVEFLQQKDGGNFFFKNRAGKKLIGHSH